MIATQLLAAMQTNIMATALPLFGRDVDRFAVYTLALRQSLRGSPTGTPALSLANSLGIPSETTRRHVAALIDAGLCRRVAGGIVVTDAWHDDPATYGLLVLSHDCFIRFVEDIGGAIALPTHGRADRTYDWRVGLQGAGDMMLAVAGSNRGTHADWLDLVLFSTVLHANYRDVTPNRPARTPIRAARLARVLSLPTTTVQRHVARMIGGSLESTDRGLLVSETWMASEGARGTSAETFANIRRILMALEAKGFPFEAPASAYRVGRPPPVAIDTLRTKT